MTSNHIAMRRTVDLGLAVLLCLGTGCGGEESPERRAPERTETPADLIRDALADPDPWVVAESLRLAAASRHPQRMMWLQQGLTHADPLVRAAAIELLLPEGIAAAQQAATSLLVSGDQEQRLAVLRIIFRHGTPRFSAEAAGTLLRDRSAPLRRGTLRLMREHGLVLERAQRDPLLADSDPAVADEAFAWLASVEPEVAMDRVLRDLRAADESRRARALDFARHLTSADLWPTMRTLARSTDPQRRFAAQCILGRLGDPSVEEGLRTALLTREDDDAALALEAISWIRTERAQSQADRQLADPRPGVRRTAVEVLIRRGVAPSRMEPFLSDGDPQIARIALRWILQEHPHLTAEIIRRNLGSTRQTEPMLRAIWQMGNESDLREVVMAAEPSLRRLASSDQPAVAWLAGSLVAQIDPGAERLPLESASWPAHRLYSAVESILPSPEPAHALALERCLQRELRMVRVACALALETLPAGGAEGR
jgi:hypothetical protein